MIFTHFIVINEMYTNSTGNDDFGHNLAFLQWIVFCVKQTGHTHTHKNAEKTEIAS